MLLLLLLVLISANKYNVITSEHFGCLDGQFLTHQLVLLVDINHKGTIPIIPSFEISYCSDVDINIVKNIHHDYAIKIPFNESFMIKGVPCDMFFRHIHFYEPPKLVLPPILRSLFALACMIIPLLSLIFLIAII